MNSEKIINNWRKNAQRHDSRNFKFLRKLKMRSQQAVDRAARELHEEVFSIVDCLQCANCCKAVRPTLTKGDIIRVSRRLEMKPAEFRTKYLVESKEELGLWEAASMPCPFLGQDNRCRIYDVRPASCAEYPHTNKRGFASRTYLHAENALQCPAVFYIIEQMRMGRTRQRGR
jgi:Fe-S-cluster containining protein